MRLKWPVCLLAFVLLSSVLSFAHHAVVIVDKDNHVVNLTTAQLAKILRAETRKWPDGKDVVLVFHKSSPDETSTLERVNKMTRSQVESFMTSRMERTLNSGKPG